MTPLSLFASRPFVGLTVLTFLVYGALGGLLVALPFTLIHQFGFHGVQAGLALLPFPLLLVCLSPVMGGLAGKIGSKPLLTLGAVLLAAGLALLLRVGGEHARYLAAVLPALLTIALGIACTAAPLTTAVLGSVGRRARGHGLGLQQRGFAGGRADRHRAPGRAAGRGARAGADGRLPPCRDRGRGGLSRWRGLRRGAAEERSGQGACGDLERFTSGRNR